MDDFIFDGRILSGYGYMICSFDSVGIEKLPVFNSTFNTIKSPLSKSSKKISINDEENLQKVIQICKKKCNNEYMEISTYEISELTRWLCRSEYKWIQFLSNKSNDGIDEVFYEAQIIASKIMIGESCYGLELQINTNRSHGLTQELVLKFNISEENRSIKINTYSDEETYIYPDVVITLNEPGNLEIINEYENRITKINNCIEGETISMFGDILQLTSSEQSHEIYNDFNYNYLRLCNMFQQSINIITFNLNCTVTIKYRGIRKVGI